MKRTFDILLSSISLIALLPFFILMSAAIRLGSPGSPIFKHARVGLQGKKFLMWKFRTMVTNAHKSGPALTQHDDMRITRIGRLLRRTSLDELPQIVNVLKGDMSIVGPRPEIPAIVETYTSEQRLALRVRPGITGLSQINGRDDLPIERKVQYDLAYVKNPSMLFDLKIILQTIPAVVNARGNRY